MIAEPILVGSVSTYEAANLAIQFLLFVVVLQTLKVYTRLLKATRRQIKIAELAQRSQSTLEVIKHIQSDDVRESRRHLYSKVQDKRQLSQWSEDDKSHAARVCAAFDIAAIMAEADLIESEIILVNWGATITRCHAICAPLIEERRLSDPQFAQFSNFCEKVPFRNRWQGEIQYLAE